MTQQFDEANLLIYMVSQAQLQMPSVEITENTVCGICLANLYGGGNTHPLEYSGNIYHASCANLWVNCVESSLPALQGSLLWFYNMQVLNAHKQ